MGAMTRDAPHSRCFFSRIHLVQEMHMCTYEKILRYTKYGLGTRQIKMTGQKKPGEMPHNNDFKKEKKTCHECMTQQTRHSPSESAYVPKHMYNSLSSFHKYFTCFTTFHLCPFVQACVPDHWSSSLVDRIWYSLL